MRRPAPLTQSQEIGTFKIPWTGIEPCSLEYRLHKKGSTQSTNLPPSQGSTQLMSCRSQSCLLVRGQHNSCPVGHPCNCLPWGCEQPAWGQYSLGVPHTRPSPSKLIPQHFIILGNRMVHNRIGSSVSLSSIERFPWGGEPTRAGGYCPCSSSGTTRGPDITLPIPHSRIPRTA